MRRSTWYRTPCLTAGLALFLLAGGGAYRSPGLAAAPLTQTRIVQFGGLPRTYLVHVPPRFPGGRPAGLLLVLHGGGGSGAQIERHTGFSALADREGFLAIYPDAVDRNWNDGRAAAAIPAQQQNVDDVGFLSALLAGLTREFAVDPGRVYVTGASNGAFMSQRLAAEVSDKVAAIAPVIGGMAPLVRGRFAPRMPVSVLLINGTDDPLVPYRGGPVARTRGETIGVPEIVTLWTTHNRCVGDPETVLLADADPTDGTRVRRTTYARCGGGSVVTLYTIDGGGHTWPGGAQYLPRVIIGRTSRDIEATPLIWQFFAAHPRR